LPVGLGISGISGISDSGFPLGALHAPGQRTHQSLRDGQATTQPAILLPDSEDIAVLK
jgi:hypothetical protein